MNAQGKIIAAAVAALGGFAKDANPVLKGVAAFTLTAAALAATPAFAPVGVVGAIGWNVAYGTGIATAILEAPGWWKKNIGG